MWRARRRRRATDVAHQRPAGEHQPARQQRTYGRGDQRRQQRVGHEPNRNGSAKNSISPLIVRALRCSGGSGPGYPATRLLGIPASAGSPWARTRGAGRIALISQVRPEVLESWVEMGTVEPAARLAQQRGDQLRTACRRRRAARRAVGPASHCAIARRRRPFALAAGESARSVSAGGPGSTRSVRRRRLPGQPPPVGEAEIPVARSSRLVRTDSGTSSRCPRTVGHN